MSKYIFGLHTGHLTAKADDIADQHGAMHINYTEPRGEKRGWFTCPNLGSPFDQATKAAVMGAIDAAGGIEAFRKEKK